MPKELLIYTHKLTPRVSYIFRHIFIRILNIPIKFTSTIEEFVAYDGLKMSYTKAPLGNEFFIQSHGLLFEQGIDDIDITVQTWDSTICFFSVGLKSVIPYDIFSASFYLLSRYEEYMPFVLDKYDCFPAEESIAYKNNFLDKPIIDIWAHKLLKVLLEKYPEFNYIPNTYTALSTINISHTFLYRSKGLVRSIVGGIYDLLLLKLYRVWIRVAVLSTFKKDPYNTYDKILDLKNKYGTDTYFFFLISNYTTYDINISPTKSRYKLLIKSIADYTKVGLLSSYFTMENQEDMSTEINRLSKIINTPTLKSKQHHNRFKLPETYQSLIDLGVTEEYSMGYYNQIGFRAGTCTPFYFYDLNFEIQTPLKVFSYAFTDNMLRKELELSPKQALIKVNHVTNLVKQVNGTFISVFHNESLSNFGEWKYWDTFYEDVMKIISIKSPDV